MKYNQFSREKEIYFQLVKASTILPQSVEEDQKTVGGLNRGMIIGSLFSKNLFENNNNLNIQKEVKEYKRLDEPVRSETRRELTLKILEYYSKQDKECFS